MESKKKKNCCFFFFGGAHPWHAEVPGPGIKSMSQLQTVPQLQQFWILNPLYQTGNRTGTSTETSQIINPRATVGTPLFNHFLSALF